MKTSGHHADERVSSHSGRLDLIRLLPSVFCNFHGDHRDASIAFENTAGISGADRIALDEAGVSGRIGQVNSDGADPSLIHHWYAAHLEAESGGGN